MATMLLIVGILYVMIGCNSANASNCNCISKQQLLELVHIINTTQCNPFLSTDCNPVLSSIVTATPKRNITLATPPRDIMVNGNDVFVSLLGDSVTPSSVAKYDQYGNLTAMFSIPPSERARFLEIKDDNLYLVARIANSSPTIIFVKSVSNDTDQFIQLSVLSTSHTYMRATPNGEHFLLGIRGTSIITVYNIDFTVNTTINVPSAGIVRDMHFDVDCNVYITNQLSEIYVYNKKFESLRTITYPGAEELDGWVFQCDGGKIFGDLTGKLIFVDKDDNVQQIFTEGFNGVRDAAITESGALFIIDREGYLIIYY